VGNLVRYGTLNKYNNFSQFQDIYIALGSSTGAIPYDTPASWTLKAHTDNTYYNEKTVIWNERQNLFQGSFTLLPSRYFNFKGKLLAPRGIVPYINYVYEVFGGTTYLQWLSDGASSYVQGTYRLKISVNGKGGQVPLRAIGVGITVDEKDYSAGGTSGHPDFTVSNLFQSVTIPAADTEFRNGQIGVGCPPDSNEEPIISNAFYVEMSTQTNIRIFSFITRFRTVFRTLIK